MLRSKSVVDELAANPGKKLFDVDEAPIDGVLSREDLAEITTSVRTNLLSFAAEFDWSMISTTRSPHMNGPPPQYNILEDRGPAALNAAQPRKLAKDADPPDSLSKGDIFTPYSGGYPCPVDEQTEATSHWALRYVDVLGQPADTRADGIELFWRDFAEEASRTAAFLVRKTALAELSGDSGLPMMSSNYSSTSPMTAHAPRHEIVNERGGFGETQSTVNVASDMSQSLPEVTPRPMTPSGHPLFSPLDTEMTSSPKCQVFLWNGIQYEIMNHRGRMAQVGSHEACLAVAKQRLKGLKMVASTNVPSLHHPAAIMVEYYGYRVWCNAALPTEVGSTAYGSAQAGGETKGDPYLRRDTEAVVSVQNIAQKWNLKPHFVGTGSTRQYFYTNADFHIQRGNDNRLYVTSGTERLIPPLPTNQKAHQNGYLYRQFRPELVKQSRKSRGVMMPISSDCFSNFGLVRAEHHDREAALLGEVHKSQILNDVIDRLIKIVTPAQNVEHAVDLVKVKGGVSKAFHRGGACLRLMGEAVTRLSSRYYKIRAKQAAPNEGPELLMPIAYLVVVLRLEMIARALKTLVRRFLRNRSGASIMRLLVGSLRVPPEESSEEEEGSGFFGSASRSDLMDSKLWGTESMTKSEQGSPTHKPNKAEKGGRTSEKTQSSSSVAKGEKLESQPSMSKVSFVQSSEERERHRSQSPESRLKKFGSRRAREQRKKQKQQQQQQTRKRRSILLVDQESDGGPLHGHKEDGLFRDCFERLVWPIIDQKYGSRENVALMPFDPANISIYTAFNDTRIPTRSILEHIVESTGIIFTAEPNANAARVPLTAVASAIEDNSNYDSMRTGVYISDPLPVIHTLPVPEMTFPNGEQPHYLGVARTYVRTVGTAVLSGNIVEDDLSLDVLKLTDRCAKYCLDQGLRNDEDVAWWLRYRGPQVDSLLQGDKMYLSRSRRRSTRARSVSIASTTSVGSDGSTSDGDSAPSAPPKEPTVEDFWIRPNVIVFLVSNKGNLQPIELEMGRESLEHFGVEHGQRVKQTKGSGGGREGLVLGVNEGHLYLTDSLPPLERPDSPGLTPEERIRRRASLRAKAADRQPMRAVALMGTTKEQLDENYGLQVVAPPHPATAGAMTKSASGVFRLTTSSASAANLTASKDSLRIPYYDPFALLSAEEARVKREEAAHLKNVQKLEGETEEERRLREEEAMDKVSVLIDKPGVCYFFSHRWYLQAYNTDAERLDSFHPGLKHGMRVLLTTTGGSYKVVGEKHKRVWVCAERTDSLPRPLSDEELSTLRCLHDLGPFQYQESRLTFHGETFNRSVSVLSKYGMYFGQKVLFLKGYLKGFIGVVVGALDDGLYIFNTKSREFCLVPGRNRDAIDEALKPVLLGCVLDLEVFSQTTVRFADVKATSGSVVKVDHRGGELLPKYGVLRGMAVEILLGYFAMRQGIVLGCAHDRLWVRLINCDPGITAAGAVPLERSEYRALPSPIDTKALGIAEDDDIIAAPRTPLQYLSGCGMPLVYDTHEDACGKFGLFHGQRITLARDVYDAWKRYTVVGVFHGELWVVEEGHAAAIPLLGCNSTEMLQIYAVLEVIGHRWVPTFNDFLRSELDAGQVTPATHHFKLDRELAITTVSEETKDLLGVDGSATSFDAIKAPLRVRSGDIVDVTLSTTTYSVRERDDVNPKIHKDNWHRKRNTETYTIIGVYSGSIWAQKDGHVGAAPIKPGLLVDAVVVRHVPISSLSIDDAAEVQDRERRKGVSAAARTQVAPTDEVTAYPPPGLPELEEEDLKPKAKFLTSAMVEDLSARLVRDSGIPEDRIRLVVNWMLSWFNLRLSFSETKADGIKKLAIIESFVLNNPLPIPSVNDYEASRITKARAFEAKERTWGLSDDRLGDMKREAFAYTFVKVEEGGRCARQLRSLPSLNESLASTGTAPPAMALDMPPTLKASEATVDVSRAESPSAFSRAPRFLEDLKVEANLKGIEARVETDKKKSRDRFRSVVRSATGIVAAASTAETLKHIANATVTEHRKESAARKSVSRHSMSRHSVRSDSTGLFGNTAIAMVIVKEAQEAMLQRIRTSLRSHITQKRLAARELQSKTHSSPGGLPGRGGRNRLLPLPIAGGAGSAQGAGSLGKIVTAFRYKTVHGKVLYFAEDDAVGVSLYGMRRGEVFRYTSGDMAGVCFVVLGVANGVLWRYEVSYEGSKIHHEHASPFMMHDGETLRKYHPCERAAQMTPRESDPFWFPRLDGPLMRFDITDGACSEFGVTHGHRYVCHKPPPDLLDALPGRSHGPIITAVGVEGGDIYFAMDRCGAFTVRGREPVQEMGLEPLYCTTMAAFTTDDPCSFQGPLEVTRRNKTAIHIVNFDTTAAMLDQYRKGLRHGMMVRLPRVSLSDALAVSRRRRSVMESRRSSGVPGAIIRQRRRSSASEKRHSIVVTTGEANEETHVDAVIVGVRNGTLYRAVLREDVVRPMTAEEMRAFTAVEGSDAANLAVRKLDMLKNWHSFTDGSAEGLVLQPQPKFKAFNSFGSLCLFDTTEDATNLFGFAYQDLLEYTVASIKRRCVVVGVRNDALWKMDLTEVSYCAVDQSYHPKSPDGEPIVAKVPVATMFNHCNNKTELEQLFGVVKVGRFPIMSFTS